MINIEEERKAFEIEWIKLGGDFKSFSIIDNMYVLIPSMASADDVIKELAERAVNSAFALWLIQSRQKQVVIDDLNIQLKDAKATPEGFVLVPKLSANYLFNQVPELGFKHQDEKDTVLYHLNYMASEFKESAKNFVVLDHEKQKRFIEESGLNPYRTDFQIIEQTLELVDLLASSTNVFQRDPESKVYPFESKNPRVIEWWRTACQIQELLTNTDPENCDFEKYKTMIEAQEQSHD